MEKFEATQLLLLASLVDSREITDERSAHWCALLGDITFEEAERALLEFRRTSTEYLQPAHIIQIVAASRARAYRRRDIRAIGRGA